MCASHLLSMAIVMMGLP